MRTRWGDKRWDMRVQDTQSWNGGVRDGGCIPRVSRGQRRDSGRPAASFGPWASASMEGTM